jgi:hypothetical protein
MKRRYFTHKSTVIDITETLDKMYEYIKKEYGVNQFQVKIIDNKRVQLTNKLGETFAEIGEIITL